MQVHVQAVTTTKARGKGAPGITINKKHAIEFNPTGYIDKRFNEILNAYGAGFSNEALSVSHVNYGGHSNIRAAVDSLQADCLARACLSY